MSIAENALVSVSIGLAAIGFFFMKYEMKKIATQKMYQIDNKQSIYIIYWGIFLSCCIGILVIMHFVYVDRLAIEIAKMVIMLWIVWLSSVPDYKYHIIPNDVILTGLCIRVLLAPFEIFFLPDNWKEGFLSSVVGVAMVSGMMLICLLLMKNSIGMGDIKLLMLVALYTGVTGITTTLFFSFTICFFVAIFLLITKQKNRKDTLPFAPFMLLGAYMAIILTGM